MFNSCIKSKYSFILLLLAATLFVTSCTDDSDPDVTQGVSSDGWISNLGLDRYTGELSITDTDEYLVAGHDYILKVDIDGNVTQEILDPFTQAATGLSTRTILFDDKIYRFTSIGYGHTDATKKMELEVYDNNGNLLQSTELDATYTLINVIMDQNKMTLLTWNWNDPTVQGASTHIFQVDNNGQQLFNKNLTDFPNVTGRLFDFIPLQNGNFLFAFDHTLYKVDDSFELISSVTLSNRPHEFSEGPNGNIYVGGHFSQSENFLLKLDGDLNTINEINFDNQLINPLDDNLTGYAVGAIAVDGDHIYSLEIAYEYGQELRLQCFDQDFNKEAEIILEGSGPLSDLKINELGSVSFLYGNPYAPFNDFPDGSIPTEARLFKINLDCELPETIINN